ncbi:MAG: hypothetical protein COT00_03190 [Candidatus Omnitrophica bacterium CG07_land_8_20_14_0_80_50_8]|nr:MAG: hypothetical protein COT00_03190 [Candidatus Omnitrophica bacterium CG07_land_8_20_14_0_80_50_8]
MAPRHKIFVLLHLDPSASAWAPAQDIRQTVRRTRPQSAAVFGRTRQRFAAGIRSVDLTTLVAS